MMHDQILKYKAKFHSFLKERNKLSYKAIDFVLMTLFILVLAAGAPIGGSYFALTMLIFTTVVLIFRKQKLDSIIFIFLAIWVLINVVAEFRNDIINIPMSTYVSRTIRMIIPYFLIKSIGSSFFDKFFKYAFVLVVISLPLYVLQLAIPSLTSSISPLFSFMTGETHLDLDRAYTFFYMFRPGGSERNTGFMWEPGAYAGILIFMMFYYWFRNGVKIDKKIIVIFVALLTTLSTSGYFAAFFAVLYYLYYSKKNQYMYVFSFLFFIVFIFGSIWFYNSSEFMSGKVNMYLDRGVEGWGRNDDGSVRLTRLGMLLVSFDDFFHYPLGNGTNLSDHIIQTYGRLGGPSAISAMIREWGIFFFVFYGFIFYYFKKIFNLSTVGIIMFTISISCLFFSNPFSFNYLIYAIFFYAFMYKKYNVPELKRNLLKQSLTSRKSN